MAATSIALGSSVRNPPIGDGSAPNYFYAMSLERLTAEYPGDAAWRRFTETFPPVGSADLRIEDDSLARVLLADMGIRAAEWLQKPIGALGNKSAADVLANHPQGTMAVRSVLMRMPR